MAEKKGSKKKAAKPRPQKKPEAEHSLEKGFEQFGEEMEKLGDRLGTKFEKKGDEWDSWFRSTFGVIGPLISSVIGIIILAVAVLVLSLINVPLQSGFLYNIQVFFMANMGLFFLFILYFSYTSYFSKASPSIYVPFSPILTAIGIVIGFWFTARVITIANISLGINILTLISSWIDRSLFLIFWLVTFIGYLVLLAKISSGKTVCCWTAGERKGGKRISFSTPITRGEAGKVKRLYRSGKDRILGGVCGGIAEYLGIDPVIVRLGWVLISLVYGVGVLLYIIMWIIVPRNPKHKWD
jgi:phage shock protein C